VRVTDTKILYIAGPGRSGSTLLADILGQIEGWTNVGELMFFWRNRQPGSTRSCGCGSLLVDCAFWTEVAELAPGAASLDPSVIDLAYRARAATHWPGLMVRERRHDAAFGQWRDAVAELYAAVSTVTGCRVIVDPSKQPAAGLVATATDVGEMSLLQLTRDPRAVVTSWLHPKSSERFPDEQLFAMRPSRSTFDWVVQSAATSLVLRRRVAKGRFLRMAYEQLVAEPRANVERIATWMGEPGVALPFTSATTVVTEPTHSIAGNPDRLGAAERTIVDHERWRSELDPGTRRMVELATWPLARAYGYR
jgi:hypothetical protein